LQAFTPAFPCVTTADVVVYWRALSSAVSCHSVTLPERLRLLLPFLQFGRCFTGRTIGDQQFGPVALPGSVFGWPILFPHILDHSTVTYTPNSFGSYHTRLVLCLPAVACYWCVPLLPFYRPVALRTAFAAACNCSNLTRLDMTISDVVYLCSGGVDGGSCSSRRWRFWFSCVAQTNVHSGLPPLPAPLPAYRAVTGL
jgi:hypothetical protein